MIPSPFKLCADSLRRAPLFFVGLSALAVLPPSLVTELMGWDSMHPGGYLAEVVWFPVTALCSLALLRRMGHTLNPEAGSPQLRGATLQSAISSEILLSMRFSSVILLAALPALIVIAARGLDPLTSRAALPFLLGVGASLPCALWIARRSFAAPIVLWQGLNGSQALAESRRLSQGRLKELGWPFALLGIVFIFQLLSMISIEVELFCSPLAFFLSASASATAYRILTL